MKAAPCSCRVVMNLMGLSINASMISTFSSPGTPKIYSTPSFSRHFTNSSAAFMSFPFAWDNLGGCRVCETTLRCQFFRPPLDAEKRIKRKVKELINDMHSMIERAHKCMFKCAYTRAVAQSQNASLVSHYDRVSHSSLGIFVRGRFCGDALQCFLHCVHFHPKSTPVAFAQCI